MNMRTADSLAKLFFVFIVLFFFAVVKYPAITVFLLGTPVVVSDEEFVATQISNNEIGSRNHSEAQSQFLSTEQSESALSFIPMPDALYYCFNSSVPHESRIYISAGFHLWDGAYKIVQDDSLCNLFVGFSQLGTYHGLATGNLCDENIGVYEIKFNSDIYNSTTDWLAMTASHEIGHVLCLDHSDDPSNIMYPHFNSWPNADDINIARNRISEYLK